MRLNSFRAINYSDNHKHGLAVLVSIKCMTRSEAIMWIRIRVAELGIKAEQVFPPPEPTSTKKKEESRTLYRDAFGNSWDGNGEFPGWLQRYVNAGQSPDFYRVDA